MTHGISPKAILAFVFPAIATTLTVVIGWIATGTFNASELRIGLAGWLTSALAALGAWLAPPGNVTTTIGPPSDQLLAARAHVPLSDDELMTLSRTGT